MVVSSVGVVVVEFSMQMPKPAVVCAMLGPAIEAFLVLSLMGSREAAMYSPMLDMIAGMATLVSLFIVVG